MKSWRTTLNGLACFAIAGFMVKYNLHHGLFNIHDPEETLRYWGLPLAFMHSGLIGWHARDHKADDKQAGPAPKDKDTDK